MEVIMKKSLFITMSMIGIFGMCDGMLKGGSPQIIFHKKNGEPAEMRLDNINSTIFSDMSPQSLELIKCIAQFYMSYTGYDKDDEFTADDAFFAVNGVKMQLKRAISFELSDKEKLLDEAISSLISIREHGYYNILGLRYCLAILCIHFRDKVVSMGFKEIPDNVEEYGQQLMSMAAKSKLDGGDDDFDAASYLQYYKK
jgi:hypothetical protein